MTTHHAAVRGCPPACATDHTTPFGPAEHMQRFGSVAASRDPVDGGDHAPIAVETLYPADGTPTVVLASGGYDEADDMLRHLTADAADALAAKLTAAAQASRDGGVS